MNFKDRPDNHQGSVPVSDDSPLLVLSPCHAQRPCQPRNNPLVFSPTNYLLGISSKATMTIGAPTKQWNSNLVERSMKLTSIAVRGCFFPPIQFCLFKSPPPLCGCNSRFQTPTSVDGFTSTKVLHLNSLDLIENWNSTKSTIGPV
jgi:hypothetical protein